MLTTFDMDEYVYEALRAGASGFLLKDVPPEQLVVGIRAVASGDALLAPSVTRRVVEEFVRRPPDSARPAPPELEELTERELEVLKLLARGLSNAEIAKELFVSDATVKTHVAKILMKLELRDRVQAVVFAYENGVVQPRLTKEAREATVLQHPPAGLAGGAVEDRVLVVVDLGERRAAARARLAETPVDEVDGLVARAALAELEAARELGVDRRRQPVDLLRRELRRERERRQPRDVEDLVRPRSTDPGEQALVAQQRVQPA